MNFWKKMPLSRAALPFVIGVFCTLELGLNLEHDILPITVFILTLLVGLFYFPASKKKNSIVAIVLLSSLFFLGVLRGSIHQNMIHENQLNEWEKTSADYYLLELNGEITQKKNSYKSEAHIIGVAINDSLIPHHEKTLVYFSKDIDVLLIDSAATLFVQAKPSVITPPKNPGEFNYKKYLEGLGIGHQFYLDSTAFHVLSNKTYSVSEFFSEMRQTNLAILQDLGLTGDAFSVVSALVFGQKDFLDKSLYAAYGAAGATHVLAVSGLHVGLIYVILVWLCKGLKRTQVGRIASIILILLGLWTYAAITGLSPSVLRASTMFTFITIAQFTGRGSNIFNTIAASAIFLLIIWPNLIMEVGFQLSYTAVLGILLTQPYLYNLLQFNNFLADKAWQISTVSIAAQLGTFPLGMLYFHQFPNYFMLSNLIVIPLATLILYVSLSVLLVSFFTPLASVLVNLLTALVDFLNYTIRKIELLPYSKTAGIDISVTEAFLLYLILGLGMGVLIKRKFSILKLLLMSCILFLGLQCLELYEQKTQFECTIHEISKERAISVIDGNKCYFLCSPSLYENEDKIQFHVSHYWDRLGIKHIEFIGLDTTDYHCNAFTKIRQLLVFKEFTLNISGSSDQHGPSSVGRHYALLNEISVDMPLSSSIQFMADSKTRKRYLLQKDATLKENIRSSENYALTID